MPDDEDQTYPGWAVRILTRLARLEEKVDALGKAPLVPPVKQGIPAAGLGAGVGASVTAIIYGIVQLVQHFS